MIKVHDLAYCRKSTPDLDRNAQFLLDFGLLPVEREDGRRFYRTADTAPFCYELESGPSRFLGFAFNARSMEDLELLARAQQLPIEPVDGPGGGSRVRLQEPNGYDVDVVFGARPVAPLAVHRQDVNSSREPLRRAGELYRLERGKPTPLRRLAHVVLGSPKVRETTDWFRETLGMISSDEVVAGPDKTLIGCFIRVDSGDEYVDHHSVFIIANPVAGLQHISFESQDIDAVMADHHYLKGLNRYDHMWGIGRHLLGSQVFDYWADPFGYPHEHWADSDRLNASAGTNIWDAREGMVTQWGEEPPEKFRKAIQP